MYDDVLHPPFIEVGNTLQGVVGGGISAYIGTRVGDEKIPKYIEKEIPQYYENRKISRENIQTSLEIAVPTIAALRYANKGELKKINGDIIR